MAGLHLVQSETYGPEPAPGPGQGRLLRLIRWLDRGGASVSRLGIEPSADAGRGIRALEAIAEDEVVLEVPLRLILTTGVARASEIGRRIAASGIALRSSHTWLACLLLQERSAADSFWRPYLDTLPESFPRLPIFFSPEELALLEGSAALGRIRERKSGLAAEHRNLCRHVPGFDRFRLDDFVWARLAVLTRVFGIEVHGGKTDGLVPMADMLNHRRPRETSWGFDDGRGAFVIRALRDFAPGDPVHDSYGRKCNARFFVNYGFCLEDNPDNEAVIRFQSEDGWDGEERRFRVPANLAAEKARAMLSFLRGCRKGAAPRALAAACEAALRRFPATLEEDEALLAGPGLSPNARNAILMRRGEKRVLRFFLDFARHGCTDSRFPAMRRLPAPPSS